MTDADLFTYRKGLGPYFKKHQTYDPPEKEHQNPKYMPIAAKDEFHGTDGPIHTSFNDYYEVLGSQQCVCTSCH